MVALSLLALYFLAAFVPAALWLAAVHAVPERPRFLPALAVITAHAAFCTLMLLLLNSVPGFFEVNRKVYAVMNKHQPQTIDKAAHEPRRFIAIDNTLDKDLVPDSLSNAEDSAMLAITHRGRLARLLQLLATEQDRIGLVVCDLTFTVPSSHDAALRDAILELAAHRKILLAHGPSTNCAALRFNDEVMADATESLQGGLVAWHGLMKEGRPSIPYAMLERLDRWRPQSWAAGLLLETRGAEKRVAFPGFMPLWTGLVTANAGESSTSGEPGSAPDDETVSIGFAIGAGWPLLRSRLSAEPGEPLPVVFIGEFPPRRIQVSEGDVHSTFLGTYRGSEMLIALYRDLSRGAHVVREGAIVFQMLVLALVSGLIFQRAWWRGRSITELTGNRSTGRSPSFLRLCGRFIWDRLRQQASLLALLMMMWFLRREFGQSTNLAALLGYLVMLNALMGELRKHRFRTHGLMTTTSETAGPPALGVGGPPTRT